MRPADALSMNVRFWHWYAELVLRDLDDEQIHWQPADHPNHIAFTLWHAYRSEDGVLARLRGEPSVYESGGWAARLPLPPGVTSTAELDRAALAAMRLTRDDLLGYVAAVRDATLAWLEGMTEEEASEEVEFPFFEGVYPGYSRMSRLDAVAFFAIGHVCEHLGEVQYIKGLMGLQGAPL